MKKYIVENEEFEALEEAVDCIMDNADFDDAFADFLHDEYDDEVEICGEYYDAVDVLYNYDRDAYNDKFDMWLDGKREEVENRIRRAEVGSVLSIDGFEVEITDTDAEMFKEALNNIEFLRTWVKNCPPLYTAGNDEAMECLNNLSAFVGAMEQRIKEEE